MRIKIDIELEKSGLSPPDFFLLYCISNNIEYRGYFMILSTEIVDKGYALFIQSQDKYILTAKGRKLFDQVVNIDIEGLAKEYRELFPKGIKTGGYPIRSNLPDIVKKFEKFFKTYSYSAEEILGGTKMYIHEQTLKNWAYTMMANYFILKEDGVGTKSMLATYIELYKERGDAYLEQINEKRL